MPDRERFGLVSQMQRCAVSVSSNIAEGFGRGSTKELVQFLVISRGSVMELETQLTIAVRVGLIAREAAVPVWQESEQIARTLSIMIAKLKKRIKSKPTNH